METRCKKSSDRLEEYDSLSLRYVKQVSGKKERAVPAASTKEPEEREFVMNSGASMHMVSKRDFKSAELVTMRTSRSPTRVMTANGEVQTRAETKVYVKELDLFVTVALLDEIPAVLSLGKLCEDHGRPTTGPAAKNHISPKRARELIAIFQTMYHS